jgi:hypothetical protein
MAISVSVYQPSGGAGEYEVLAQAFVDRGSLRVEGRRRDLVDTERRVYSARRRRFVRAERDPEEWLRSYAEGFRTAQVAAAITRDSAHRDLIAPADLLEQLERASAVATASF